MTVTPLDRRSVRREATRAEIVAAAWDIAREQGLSGLSMRDLGERVGMRAQSVYTYFASKDDIYDAMFRQGYEEFIAYLTADSGPIDPPLERVRAHAHRFFLFCTTDPVRYQLLFLRTIPGFEPSAESYAVAVLALQRMHDDLVALGVDDPQAGDLATALFTGLVSQQIANEPGGSRWLRLVDRAASMLLAEVAPHLLDPTPPATPRKKARP